MYHRFIVPSRKGQVKSNEDLKTSHLQQSGLKICEFKKIKLSA